MELDQQQTKVDTVHQTVVEQECIPSDQINSLCCCWKFDDYCYYKSRHVNYKNIPEQEPFYCCVPMCVCCVILPISCIVLPKLSYRHYNSMCCCTENGCCVSGDRNRNCFYCCDVLMLCCPCLALFTS